MPALAMPTKNGSASSRQSRWLTDPEVLLMLRVQREEPGAFTDLVERYGPMVFARFFRQLGDRQEAEDLTQDVFLRLYRHRTRYQPTAKFSTWLFHITQNVVRNAIRARRRHPSSPISVYSRSPGELHELPARGIHDDSPSRSMERRELAFIVRQALTGLGSRQRTALELHQFRDYTYAEIAREMDMSPKAAKSLLYRARNQLRLHLTKMMEQS